MSAKKVKRKKKNPQKRDTSQKTLERGSSNLTPPNIHSQSKMQQTQETPQPQHSQTQNSQNNSSRDITYNSTPAPSTVPEDSNRLVVDEDEHNDEQDKHNVTKDIFRDHTDDSSEKTTDLDNCNDEDDFGLNNPKTFDESSKENDLGPDKQRARRYNQAVTVVLPTTEQIIRKME